MESFGTTFVGVYFLWLWDATRCFSMAILHYGYAFFTCGCSELEHLIANNVERHTLFLNDPMWMSIHDVATVYTFVFIHAHANTHTYTYIYTCMHAYMHTNIHDMTWHDMPCRAIAWHDKTWHDIAWHYMTWYYIALHYITFHYSTFHYIALHCIHIQ